MTETASSTISDTVWQQLGHYLHRDDVRLLSLEHQQELRVDWEDVTHQEQLLDDALLIGLVGGTGVGKSTFINALAGEVVSRSSDRRPTTDRVVVYRHAETPLPDEVPTEDLARPEVLHRHDQISKVVLFDFPDFDSAERSHSHILQRYLEFLDVLLIVVDDIKYADRRLYELLSALDHSAANLFVLLNKVDRLQSRYGSQSERVIEDLLRDLREKLRENANLDLAADQLFPISAVEILRARVDGSELTQRDPLKRFRQVENLLENYQEDKHRRQAKEHNIDARKEKLAAEIRNSALGKENRSILKETRQLIEDWKGELDKAIQTIPQEMLIERERRALRKSRLRRAGPRWGFPFSFAFTLIGELPWSRKADALLEQDELAARIHQHYRGFFEATKNLQARFQTEFAGSEIAESGLGEVALASPDQWSASMATQVRAEIQEQEQDVARWQRWACHIPAALTLLLACWSQVHSLLDGGFFSAIGKALLAILNPTAILGVVIAVILAYLLTAVALWVRELQILDRHIAIAEKQIRDEVEAHRDEALQQLDENINSLTEEFRAVEAMVG